MTTDRSKVTLHMVASLDGFIAKRDGNVTWMQSTDRYEQGVTLTEEDIVAYLQTIDCYVMGSATYEHAVELGWPYGDKPVSVLTHRDLTSDRENVTFYSGDLGTLVNDQLKPNHRSIWLVGGAVLAKAAIRAQLVDDIIISIMPVLLGEGLLFFDHIGREQALHLKDVTAYKDGMVELWYEVKKE
ncbi:dihydrofolate reductase family protein [Spongiimicrobium sp. 2-473A-2-J]|uniref:dihydrofolate reductase family protein n=1 Tax=Eudoraea algarum TaxID=3417568 RepID=UPI003D36BCB8